MSISLQTFRKLTNGFARAHHFNLGILDPKITQLSFANYALGVLTAPLLNLFCSSTSLPQKTIATQDHTISHGIPPITIADNVTYSPWSVTFVGDELMLLRTFFLLWMENVNDSKKKTFNVPSVYKSNYAFAAVLTPGDFPVHVYTFKGLFPIDVQGVQVSQQDSGLLQFTVNFAYDYFIMGDPIGYGLSLGTEFLLGVGAGKVKGPALEFNAPFGISIKP